MNRAYERWLKTGALMGLATGVAAMWLRQKSEFVSMALAMQKERRQW